MLKMGGRIDCYLDIGKSSNVPISWVALICNSVILQLCRICGLETEHEQTRCSWSESEVCSCLSISLSKSLTFIVSSLSFWAALCRHQVVNYIEPYTTTSSYID